MNTSLSLDSLASAINAAHTRCERSYATMLEDAKCAGELLLQAKAQVTHGEWTTWIANHCQFSDRTARRYMQIASGWEQLESKAVVPTDLALEAAIDMIADKNAPEIQSRKVRRLGGGPLRPLSSVTSSPTFTQNPVQKVSVRPGDKVRVIDTSSPEHGLTLEVTEVVQDAIAMAKKGSETYPLLVNQVEVVSSREDIKDIKSSAAGVALLSSTTTASPCKPGEPHKNELSHSGKAVSSSPSWQPLPLPQKTKEITVAALQDILRRILGECEEYLSPELIDEARELL